MSKKRPPAMLFIFIVLLIDVTGFGIIIPVMPRLIAELIHGTISDASQYAGWLMFAFAIMQFLCSPILGSLSDKFGRRPVLLTALFGFGCDYLILAFAPNIFWLFIGRTIAGITGASFTTAMAYIADVSPPEKRAQNFGMVGAAFGMGFIIGPMIGGELVQFGLRVPFFAAAGFTLLNWLYGYFILPESLDHEHRRKFDWKRANPWGSLKHLFKYPVITGLVASIFLLYLAAHAVQSTWTFYTMFKFNWNERDVGYSLGFVGLLIGIVQGGLTRMVIPKIGQKNSVALGLTLYTIGFVLLAFATQSWMMYAFLVPYCFGGFAGPALQGIMSSQVPKNEQGELQGALTSLVSVTTIIGPTLMTNLFHSFTKQNAAIFFPGAPFLLGGIFCVISLYLAMRTLAKHKH